MSASVSTAAGRPPFFYGWVIVAVCTVCMTMGYGIRHSFSVFFPSILDEFGWSRASTAVMLSLHLFFYGIFAPLAGSLSDLWQPKRIMMIGAIILGLATALCGIANSLWHFYIIFGLFTPIGLAFLGAPVVTPTIINWFFRSRGLAYGLAQMGGGLSFVFAFLIESLISSTDWRMAYIILGVVLVVVLIPLLLGFFFYHPYEKKLLAYGLDESKHSNPSVSFEKENLSDQTWTLKKAARTYQFWMLVLSMTLFWGAGCYLVLAHQVKYAQDMGYSSLFASSIFGLFGVFMVVGQIISSVSDRIGREVVLVTGCLIAIGAVFCLSQVQDTTQPWLLYVYAVFFGFGAGLQSPTIFVGASDLFAGPHFGAIAGVILCGMGIGGALGPWIGGYVYDILGSYSYAFGFSMTCFAVSALAFILAAPRRAIPTMDSYSSG